MPTYYLESQFSDIYRNENQLGKEGPPILTNFTSLSITKRAK